MIHIRRREGLAAVVVRTLPLRYSAGPDPALDRPAHVRAGSGLCWAAGRLAVVQDDAAFLAMVDPATGRVDAIPLPVGPDGARQWGDDRGTKRLKPDLEACVALSDDSLLAFGSGSTAMRERVLRVTGVGGKPRAEWIPCTELYAMLRGARGFSGSEMNLEGAALLGDRIRLFNRGNGAPRDGVAPIDATCDLPLAALLAYLDGAGGPPAPGSITGYDLGTLEGGRLTFTDAATRGHALFCCAAAEDSPDTYRDGPVIGSMIGWLGEDAAWAPLTDTGGSLLPLKVEGIAPSRDRPDLLWAVVDRDDPATPSELCEVELRGAWPGPG